MGLIELRIIDLREYLQVWTLLGLEVKTPIFILWGGEKVDGCHLWRVSLSLSNSPSFQNNLSSINYPSLQISSSIFLKIKNIIIDCHTCTIMVKIKKKITSHNRWMTKQTVVCLYHRIPLSNKRTQTTDTYNTKWNF